MRPGGPTLVSRRELLKTAALAPAILGAAADAPPNILFFICDQMRADALGASGRSNGRTPNLDRLASQGVMFENAFSNNPVCVPSRKSMWTSRYPHQHGSLTNRDGESLELPDTALGYFRDRGYRIGYAGKNHAFSKKAMAVDARKVLASAIANAENNHNLDVDALVVAEASVGKSVTMKRFHTRGRGKSTRILKPFSRLRIVVREVEEA